MSESIPTFITNPTYLQSCSVDKAGKPMVVLHENKKGFTSPADMLRYQEMGLISDVEISQSEAQYQYGRVIVKYNRK